MKYNRVQKPLKPQKNSQTSSTTVVTTLAVEVAVEEVAVVAPTTTIIIATIPMGKTSLKDSIELIYN